MFFQFTDDKYLFTYFPCTFEFEQLSAAQEDLGQVPDGFERDAEQLAIQAQRQAVWNSHVKVARHLTLLGLSALCLNWASALEWWQTEMQPCVTDLQSGLGGWRCTSDFVNRSIDESGERGQCAADAPLSARVCFKPMLYSLGFLAVLLVLYSTVKLVEWVPKTIMFRKQVALNH